MKELNGVKDKTAEVYMQYCDWFLKRDDKLNSRVKWTLLEHEANKSGVTLNAGVPPWQINVHWHIGQFLYDIITEDLKIESNYVYKNKKATAKDNFKSRAFFKIYRHAGVKLLNEVGSYYFFFFCLFE